MGDNEIAEKIKGFIEKHLMVERQKITDEARFIDDLGADSLDVVEMIMELEDKFGIEIPDEEAEKLITVGKAIEYVKGLVVQKEGV